MRMNVSNVRLKSLAADSAKEIARCFERCFHDYLIPITGNALARINRMLITKEFCPSISYKVEIGGRAIGVALVSEKGKHRRLAAMAIEHGYRGHGIGRSLLNEVIERAQVAGSKSLVLEVLAQNLPAIHLYQQAGFDVTQRLFGYSASMSTLESRKRPRIVAVDKILDTCDPKEFAILPWQVSVDTLRASSKYLTGYELGPASAIVEHAKDCMLRLIRVPPEERRQGAATRLLSSLRAIREDRLCRTSALVPEAVPKKIFVGSGFDIDEISQFELQLIL